MAAHRLRCTASCYRKIYIYIYIYIIRVHTHATVITLILYVAISESTVVPLCRDGTGCFIFPIHLYMNEIRNRLKIAEKGLCIVKHRPAMLSAGF